MPVCPLIVVISMVATYGGCYLLKQLSPGNLFGLVNTLSMLAFSTAITGFVGMPFELSGNSLSLRNYILIDELVLTGVLVWFAAECGAI